MVDYKKDFKDIPEYSTQFFKFTPQSLVEAFHNGLSEICQDGLIEFYSRLRKNHPKGKLLNLTKPNVVNQMRESFDKYFDRLESYLRTNITQIPVNILLPEDFVHRDYPDISNDDVAKKQEEINDLTKSLLEAHHFEKLLKEELLEIDQTISSLVKMHSEMKQILAKFQDEPSSTDVLKEFSIQTSKDRQLLNEIPLMISCKDLSDSEHE